MLGFELTFIPRKPGKWKEYRTFEEANEVAKAFNAKLQADSDCMNLSVGNTPPFVAKADAFRAPHVDEAQPHRAYCIEVHNEPIRASYILNGGFATSALQAVYAIANDLHLAPAIEVHHRDGSITDWPTGGGHIHVSQLGLWDSGSSAALCHSILDRTLAIDYTNRPYLRWLFSQWSDNVNSLCALDGHDLKALQKALKRKRLSNAQLQEWAHGHVEERFAIRNRLMSSGKPCLPTWELRWFDMPRSVKELQLQVAFVKAWFEDRVKRITKSLVREDGVKPSERTKHWKAFDKEVLTFRLTPQYWRHLTKDPSFAWAETESFLRELELDPALYGWFWERGYLRRFHHGKLI